MTFQLLHRTAIQQHTRSPDRTRREWTIHHVCEYALHFADALLTKEEKGKLPIVIVAAVSIGGGIIILAAIMVCYWFRRRSSHSDNQHHTTDKQEPSLAVPDSKSSGRVPAGVEASLADLRHDTTGNLTETAKSGSTTWTHSSGTGTILSSQ